MREYLVNLTNALIGKHRFDAADAIFTREEMFAYTKGCLEVEEISKMNPETLGHIMASFELGDLMVSKQELFSSLHFGGDGEALFKELVATCLAHAIVIRFHAEEAAGYGVPAYRRGKERGIAHRK